jgi:voltage-dependent potassium channel beta subunit
MKYRNLGKYGIKLSEVGFGTWLTFGSGIEFNDARKCIQVSLEQGINFFDSADVYAKGEAEKVLGKILWSELKVKRQDVVVATKCYFPMSQNPNDQGLSRKHIFESVNNSLKRLRTDYIDIMQCHRFDPKTPIEETCRAYNDLILQGKILYWGVSEWSAQNIEDAVMVCEKNNLHKPVSNQPQYNILRSQIETNGVIDVSEKYGLGQVVWSPLAQGMLTGKYSGGKVPDSSRAASDKMNWFLKDMDKTVIEKADKLSEFAASIGASAAQLALAWCLRKSNITSVIIGASRKKQVVENCGAVEIEYTLEIDNKIKEIFN